MKMTIITCDKCGRVEHGTNYSPMINRLRKEGWTRGKSVDNDATHFCPKCSSAKMIKTDGRGKK